METLDPHRYHLTPHTHAIIDETDHRHEELTQNSGVVSSQRRPVPLGISMKCGCQKGARSTEKVRAVQRPRVVQQPVDWLSVTLHEVEEERRRISHKMT